MVFISSHLLINRARKLLTNTSDESAPFAALHTVTHGKSIVTYHAGVSEETEVPSPKIKKKKKSYIGPLIDSQNDFDDKNVTRRCHSVSNCFILVN